MTAVEEEYKRFKRNQHTYHLPPSVPTLSVSLTSIDAVTALCGRCVQKGLWHLIVSSLAWSEFFFTTCSVVYDFLQDFSRVEGLLIVLFVVPVSSVRVALRRTANIRVLFHCVWYTPKL